MAAGPVQLVGMMDLHPEVVCGWHDQQEAEVVGLRQGRLDHDWQEAEVVGLRQGRLDLTHQSQ
jgi:hypothetical protein